MKIKELIVPLAIVSMIVGMMLPLPVVLLDILLVINLLLATALLLSALSVNDPIKLSALPTILLLATLYRLTLNISTTRLILSGGDAGQVVAAFGSIVIGGSLAVGLVIFLIITLIQFIVIAKGAERIAEVAARFTLDALPGKQMAIDADVRSGLIDIEKARDKREELQMESRFYGALDGAMKFVKGDAIAGLIIVAVNIIGGIGVGILAEQLSVFQAIHKFVGLTIGDGLVSQIPALLNSLTAGIVVTKVARNDNSSLINELSAQIGQGRMVKGIICFVCLLMACLPGMPAIPFMLVGIVLLLLRRSPDPAAPASVLPARFQPKIPALLAVSGSAALIETLSASAELAQELDQFRQDAFQRLGFLLPRIEFVSEADTDTGVRIFFRGSPLARLAQFSPDNRGPLITSLNSLLTEYRTEFIDDTHTRRLLDFFETTAPELISSIVPGVVSVTQLTVILRSLVRDRIAVRHFDLIAQAIAESAPRHLPERQLLEEVRVALGRVICVDFIRPDRSIAAVGIDPLIDIAFAEAERGVRIVDSGIISRLFTSLQDVEVEIPLIVGKSSRGLLADCFRARGLERTVLAFEELPPGIRIDTVRLFELAADEIDQVIDSPEEDHEFHHAI